MHRISTLSSAPLGLPAGHLLDIQDIGGAIASVTAAFTLASGQPRGGGEPPGASRRRCGDQCVEGGSLRRAVGSFGRARCFRSLGVSSFVSAIISVALGGGVLLGAGVLLGPLSSRLSFDRVRRFRSSPASRMMVSCSPGSSFRQCLFLSADQLRRPLEKPRPNRLWRRAIGAPRAAWLPRPVSPSPAFRARVASGSRTLRFRFIRTWWMRGGADET